MVQRLSRARTGVAAALLAGLWLGGLRIPQARAQARVTDPQCASAIECQVRDLFAQLGDGSTSCVQRLFKEGNKFMAKKATRIRRDRLDAIVDDLARCKERAGRRCFDPISRR